MGKLGQISCCSDVIFAESPAAMALASAGENTHDLMTVSTIIYPKILKLMGIAFILCSYRQDSEEVALEHPEHTQAAAVEGHIGKWTRFGMKDTNAADTLDHRSDRFGQARDAREHQAKVPHAF